MVDLISLLISVVGTVLIAAIVLIKNKKNLLNIIFALLNIAVALWAIANYFSLHTQSDSQILFWIRMTMFLAICQAVFFFIFIYNFPNRKLKLKKQHTILLFAVSLFSSILCFTPLVFSGITRESDLSVVPTAGLGMIFFIPNSIGLILFGIVLLIYKLKKAKGLLRSQLSYIFTGSILMFIMLIFFNFVLVNLFHNSQYVDFGALYILPFVILTTYTIIRYRFLNIKFIITRSLIYLILVAVIASLFILISTVVAQSVGRLGINPYFIWAFFALIIVLGLDPLKNWFARITDNIFFKDKIDYNAELKTLSNLINEEIELDSLVTNFRLLLAQRLKLKHNTILLAAELNQVYVPLDYFLHTNLPHSVDQIRRQHLYNNSAFIHYLSEKPQTIVTDEFDRHIYDLDNDVEQQRLGKVLENLNELQAGIVLPIMREDKLTAILVIGEKVSGETFSSEDINLFEVVASQLAAALERSRLYQEVRVFNTKLQHEIDRATASLKQSNLQLEDANSHLQELDRAKSEFMSIASHQLRTPLTGIIGYLSMILEGDYGKVDPAQNKVMAQVYEASRRLVRLVNMFLNVTRIEAGRFTLTFTEINFVDLVKSEITELLPTANQKKLQLSLDPATADTIPVMVDADKIRDVILNLIDNAIKYTQEGSIVVKVEYEGKNKVRFSVKDSGVGVDPKEAKELFHKFVRGSGIARIQPNGSGLGLYIVKKIVEGHAGKVWMESEGEGKGSTFIVVLPLNQAKEQYHAEPEAVFK